MNRIKSNQNVFAKYIIRVAKMLYRITIDMLKEKASRSQWLIDGSQHLTKILSFCLTKQNTIMNVFLITGAG